MKLKKSTWFLLFLAIVLGGWVYFYEIRLEAQKLVIKQQEQKIFNFDPKNIQKITILLQPNLASLESKMPTMLEFIKNQDTSSWLMKKPEAFPVNEGVISFLLNLIEKGTKERKLLISQDQLSQYGLDRPVANIAIQLNNQQTHQISLGKETINPNVVYAQINSIEGANETTEVLLVSKNWHYAVIRDLEEWKE